MRKLMLGLLGMGMVACQPNAGSVATATATDRPKAAAATPAAPKGGAKGPLPDLFKPTDTLTASMRAELRQVDLSQLWAGDRSNPALKGFFGPDHYRFEMVFSTVSRDAQNPALYHVTGKCHYRKNIRPFTGSLLMRGVYDMYLPYDTPADAVAPGPVKAHEDISIEELGEGTPSVGRKGRAELRITEELRENAGEFVGDATLLFCSNARHQPRYAYGPLHADDGMTNGGRLLIRGLRWNATTRQRKSFVVSDNLFAVAPEVYKDFGVGERNGEINPKYGKLGWNELWDNDEWWADSPKPSLLP